MSREQKTGETASRQSLVRQKITIAFASVIEALFLLLEIYFMIHSDGNFSMLIIIAICMAAVLFFLVMSIIELSQKYKELDRMEYADIYKAQKASYLAQKKNFDEINVRLHQLEENTNFPAEDIISAQKAVAKVTITRSKENADALMNANDELIQRVFGFEEKLADNNDALLRQQETLLQATREELLANNKGMQDQFDLLHDALEQMKQEITDLELRQPVAAPVMEVAAAASEPVTAEPEYVEEIAPEIDLASAIEPIPEAASMPEVEPVVEEAVKQEMPIEESVAEPAVETEMMPGAEPEADPIPETEPEAEPSQEEIDDMLASLASDTAQMQESEADSVAPEMAEEHVDELPSLDDLPDLGDIASEEAENDDLPSLDDLPDLGDMAEDTEELPDLGELPSLDDLPNLDDLPDMASVEDLATEELPDLGSLEDLPNLEATDDMPAMEPVPDLSLDELPQEAEGASEGDADTAEDDAAADAVAEPETPAAEESAPAEEKPPMPDLSDPNKVLSPDEIAALFANM